MLTRYDRSNGQVRDIQVYPRFFSGEPASALPERWQWTFPIVFSPLNPKALFTTSQHVWKSLDDGQSWERISPDLTLADPETLGETGGVITMDMNGPEIYATVFSLEPSQHEEDTIWAGSDDGLVHITRDGGKNWRDITPPDMPKYSRVSVIDESSHTPGTLYVAANRYQVDDRAPYVWRTRDYGKSWTKIIEGIKGNHFARAVREDPVREGLLFLGTEHGVYVSFDAGDHWQSLQLELPDTPIRDLVVHGSDVVLGTHGRGFWILDDIEPLRALTQDTYLSPLTVFESPGAFRGLTNAALQYFLADEQEQVTVEILKEMAGGAEPELVASFTGTKADEEKERDTTPSFRSPPPAPPTVHAGLNRFEWNLRYPGPTQFDGIIIWNAAGARGPKAPPGRYMAKVTAGESTETVSFEVALDPNFKGVSQEDLEEQAKLAIAISEQTSRANEAVINIRRIRGELAERSEGATSTELAAAVESFREASSTIEEALYQTKNQSGQDPLNFPIRLNNRLSSLRRSVETGDAKPTAAAYKVFEELSAELEDQLAALESLMGGDLSRANGLLVAEGLEVVPAELESEA